MHALCTYSLYFSPLFKDDEVSLLIIQCDSGRINGDLIGCARYRVLDLRANSKEHVHVLFIIHLPVHVAYSSFVGIQSDPWISCHIDVLIDGEEGKLISRGIQGVSISDIFYDGPFVTAGTERQGQLLPIKKHQWCVHLNSYIQAAVSRLEPFTQNKQRQATERVKLLINVIPLKVDSPLGEFYD